MVLNLTDNDVSSGASVGLIKDLVTVSDLIKGVQGEFKSTIARLVQKSG